MEVVQHTPQELVMNRVREQIVAVCQFQKESMQKQNSTEERSRPLVSGRNRERYAVHTTGALAEQIVAISVPQIKEQIVPKCLKKFKSWYCPFSSSKKNAMNAAWSRTLQSASRSEMQIMPSTCQCHR